jgi:hypothetical protein
VLAFDQSGSFSTYWPQALELATAYVGVLKGPRHTVSVMSFGLSRTTHCEEKSPAALSACLKDLASLGAAQQVTRLKFYIQEAVREAVRKQPLASRGSREVIVFTDAGDESDALDVKALAAEARELGVRVHVVCFTRAARGKQLAQRLDEVQQLADGSGGRYLQVEDVQDPAKAIGELARSLDRLYWLDVALCGVKPGQVYDRVSIEAVTGGQRSHWSDPVRFRQSTEGGATQPCEPQRRRQPRLPRPRLRRGCGCCWSARVWRWPVRWWGFSPAVARPPQLRSRPRRCRRQHPRWSLRSRLRCRRLCPRGRRGLRGRTRSSRSLRRGWW